MRFNREAKRRSEEATKRQRAHPGAASPSFPFVAASLRRSVASSRAFTLVEVMIAVVIVGLMAGVVTYATVGMLDRAKHKRVVSDLTAIVGALEIFHGDNGRFPTNQEGLSVLKDLKLKNDPWGHPYQYVQPGRGGAPYDVICYGADGREGGTGSDADLSSSDPEFQGAGGGKK